MKRVWAWFWALDRRAPWDAWAGLMTIGVLARGLQWLTGWPEHVPAAVGIAAAAISLTLMVGWLALYTRDAVHTRRTRGAG